MCVCNKVCAWVVCGGLDWSSCTRKAPCAQHSMRCAAQRSVHRRARHRAQRTARTFSCVTLLSSMRRLSTSVDRRSVSRLKGRAPACSWRCSAVKGRAGSIAAAARLGLGWGQPGRGGRTRGMMGQRCVWCCGHAHREDNSSPPVPPCPVTVSCRQAQACCAVQCRRAVLLLTVEHDRVLLIPAARGVSQQGWGGRCVPWGPKPYTFTATQGCCTHVHSVCMCMCGPRLAAPGWLRHTVDAHGGPCGPAPETHPLEALSAVKGLAGPCLDGLRPPRLDPRSAVPGGLLP